MSSGVFCFEPPYKCEKRASNLALSYTALTSINDHLTVLRHYVCTLCKIMQHLNVILEVFGGFNFVALSVFCFLFCLRHLR